MSKIFSLDSSVLVSKKAHNRHKPIIKKAQASTAAKAAVEACVSKHIDAKGMRIVGAMVDVSEMIIKIFQIACVVASHMTLNLCLKLFLKTRTGEKRVCQLIGIDNLLAL